MADDLDTPVSTRGSGHPWSVQTGETVNSGRDMVSFEAGWPGVSFGYTHGLSDKADIGAKFDLLYGFESTTTTQFGFGLRVPIRGVILRRNRISLMLHMDPGVKMYTSSPVNFGIQLPIGATVGVQIVPEFRVGVGFDLHPITLRFTPAVDFFLSPQFGIAFEYMVDRDFLLGLNTRFGPVFVPTIPDAGGFFGFTTQFVVGYRL